MTVKSLQNLLKTYSVDTELLLKIRTKDNINVFKFKTKSFKNNLGKSVLELEFILPSDLIIIKGL